MSKYDINWKCTYKKMPKEVKTFLQENLGKEEARKLMHAIRTHKWVMLVGPECSGKTTIRDILRTLGYPFVIDDNGIGQVIKTSKINGPLRSYSDIFGSLGIEWKY